MNAEKISITPAIENDEDLAALVLRAESILADEVKLAGDARWDAVLDDNQRTVLQLRITDTAGGEATRQFMPAELAPAQDRRFRERLRTIADAVVQVGKWKAEVRNLFAWIVEAVAHTTPPTTASEEISQVREEPSGAYEIPELLLDRNGRRVRAHPIGTWVVGAQGRVDLRSSEMNRILLFDGHQWQLVPDDVREPAIPLTKQRLISVLDELFQ
jgi:hypothetical protein